MPLLGAERGVPPSAQASTRRPIPLCLSLSLSRSLRRHTQRTSGSHRFISLKRVEVLPGGSPVNSSYARLDTSRMIQQNESLLAPCKSTIQGHCLYSVSSLLAQSNMDKSWKCTHASRQTRPQTATKIAEVLLWILPDGEEWHCKHQQNGQE